MAAKTATRSSVFHRLGREPGTVLPSKAVCIFWLKGKCNRNPCRFLHSEPPVVCGKRRSHPELSGPERKKPSYIRYKNKLVLEKSHEHVGPEDCKREALKKVLPSNIEEGGSKTSEDAFKKCSEDISCHRAEELNIEAGESKTSEDAVKKSSDDIPGHRVEELNIEEGGSKTSEDADKKSCDDIPGHRVEELNIEGGGSKTSEDADKKSYDDIPGHRVEELRTLAFLQGHTKDIVGIALAGRNYLLCSGCSDGTVWIWDCATGQCARVVDLGTKIGSFFSEGALVFMGTQNVVKVWNTKSGMEYDLGGFTGMIYAMVATDDTLFAGGQDGILLAWKGNFEANVPVQPLSSLPGHTHDVVSLAVGHDLLYSGSKDSTIRVWDHKTLECLMTLDDHADTVTSLICWDNYLFSGSLDCTIRVWGLEEGLEEELGLKVIYTQIEEHGILAFRGMTDGNGKPILYCSCDDDSVHMYELPSFVERSSLFSKQKVVAMQVGPDHAGLFFTGDQAGLITVWKWLPKLEASHQEI